MTLGGAGEARSGDLLMCGSRALSAGSMWRFEGRAGEVLEFSFVTATPSEFSNPPAHVGRSLR